MGKKDQKLFKKIEELFKQGLSADAISDQLKIDREYVIRALRRVIDL